MYSIFVLINGCAQLKKIEPEIIANIERDLALIAENYGLTPMSVTGHIYAYILPSDHMESVNICLESLRNIEVYMAKIADQLYGYTLFVSVVESDEHIELGKWHYLVDEDNKTWIISTLKELFGARIETKDKGDIQEITKIIFQKNFRPSIRDHIYQNAANLDVVETMIKRGVGQVLHLASPVGYGGYEMVYKIWDACQNRTKMPLPMIYICAQGSYVDDFLPFRRIITKEVIQMLEEVYAQSQDFMTSRLLNWLTYFCNCTSKIRSEAEKGDFLAFFRLYLPMYRRVMAGKFPVVLIENASKFGYEGSQFLQEVVDIAVKENLLVINLCEKHEGNLLQSGEPVVYMQNADATRFLSEDQELNIPASRLTNVTPMAVLLFYWNYMVNQQNYFGEFSLTPLLYWLIKGFDKLSCSVVYLISLADGMVPYEWILDATVEEKYWRALTVQRCKVFVELGLVRNLEGCPWLVIKALGDMLASHLGAEKLELEQTFVRTILAKPQYRKQINLVYLFRLLENLGMEDESYNILEKILQERLAWQSKDQLSWLNYQGPIGPGESVFNASARRLKRILETYNFMYRLQSADVDGLANMAAEVGQMINFHPETADTTSLWLLLATQAYYNGMGSPQDSPVEIKEIVNLFQRREERLGEARAILEMSYMEFLNQRFRMAFDYCCLAEQFAIENQNVHVQILSIKMQSIQVFLQGSIGRADEIVNKGIEMSLKHGYRRKELFFRFLHVRICFEYGNYQEAIGQLKKIERIAYIYEYGAMNDIVMTWRARCMGHMQQTEEALNMLKNLNSCEALYFTAEIYLLASQPKEALSVIQKAMQSLPLVHQVVPHIDIEDWFSGYSLIEGYVEKGYLGFCMLERLTQGLFYYLIGINGDYESASKFLEGLCSLESKDSDDLYAYIYFYYYGQILQEPNRKKMAHNRAVRLLNMRMNRAEDMQTRKLLENGYYAQKILNNDSTNKFL
ncbi:MAG: hypothetical protein ACRCVN_04950 [Spirochaetia bacterium]